MVAELKPRLTFDEYLQLESQNEYKSEFIDGLSSSTEAYDRGVKAVEHRRIPSLREYLLIAQDRCHIEHYVREADNRWVLSDFKSIEEVIQLSSIDCQLALAEVYDKVEWGAIENIN